MAKTGWDFCLLSYAEAKIDSDSYLQNRVSMMKPQPSPAPADRNRVAATLGLRHDWSHDDSRLRTTGLSTRYSDEATTGRAGAVYLFDSGLAPYVSYATSFEPVNGVDYYNTPFKPTEGRQAEIGIEYQPAGSRSMVTLSAYEIKQKNITTPDPDPTHLCDGRQCPVQTGAARVRGLELEGNMALSEHVTVVASATWMDSKVTKSNSTDLGKELLRVPRRTYNLWVDYRLPQSVLPGLSLGAGLHHIGSSYGDTANAYRSPSINLIDAAIRYDMSDLNPALKGLKLSLNASNLTDKEYVASCSGSASCCFGARRLVSVNMNSTW
ncbi:TonB-dependent siderophore receptor [Bordetella trematum]|uniref:TonB-dependent siderophore receptor n=1 Tax=Bordetella trematum TaxID=123899 RepID=UPI000C77797D|nr:TonB-dependent receptor [Bordetella trematum]